MRCSRGASCTEPKRAAEPFFAFVLLAMCLAVCKLAPRLLFRPLCFLLHMVCCCVAWFLLLCLSSRGVLLLFPLASLLALQCVAGQCPWYIFCAAAACLPIIRAKISLRLWRLDFACLPRVLLLVSFPCALLDSWLKARDLAKYLGRSPRVCAAAGQRLCDQ